MGKEIGKMMAKTIPPETVAKLMSEEMAKVLPQKFMEGGVLGEARAVYCKGNFFVIKM
jgi:hypothetical protein